MKLILSRRRWCSASVALAILSTGLAFLPSGRAGAAEYLVYFGTYTGKKSKGIYVSRLDTRTGRLSPAELAAETPSPSFLAVHPRRPWLYAVNEVGNFGGKPAGSVTGYTIDRATGRLTAVNAQSTLGSGPCHVTVDRSGRAVLVANYGGGSVASYPVDKTGALGAAGTFVQHRGSGLNPRRQEAPHGHCIEVDPSNRFALSCDLGLDQVLVYKLDPGAATLVPNDPPHATVAPGSGPRHLSFHPSGRFAYVINEMLCTVTAFRFEAKRGTLEEIHTVSSLPPATGVQPGYSTAEIVVHPGGKFVYGSNRGHDTLAVYAIDGKEGRLTLVDHVPTQGKTPRSFGIDPTGDCLLAANQNSDSVVVFRVNKSTGRLQPTGQTVEVGAPVSVAFVAAR